MDLDIVTSLIVFTGWDTGARDRHQSCEGTGPVTAGKMSFRTQTDQWYC